MAAVGTVGVATLVSAGVRRPPPPSLLVFSSCEAVFPRRRARRSRCGIADVDPIGNLRRLLTHYALPLLGIGVLIILGICRSEESRHAQDQTSHESSSTVSLAALLAGGVLFVTARPSPWRGQSEMLVFFNESVKPPMRLRHRSAIAGFFLTTSAPRTRNRLREGSDAMTDTRESGSYRSSATSRRGGRAIRDVVGAVSQPDRGTPSFIRRT